MYLSTDHYSTGFPAASAAPCRVTTLHEQGSGRCNEDVLLHGDNLCGVFDGATSLAGKTSLNCLPGGLRAASLAAETFRRQTGSLVQTAEEANHRIRAAQGYARIPQDRRLHLWSTSMAVVRLDHSSFEYCHTGDCMIMLLHHNGGYTLLTPELDIDSSTLELWRQSAGTGYDIHSLLAGQIAGVRLQMNRSYGVLNGEPEAMDFLRHGRHSLAGVSDILLFTDGLMLPKADPALPTDWHRFACIYRCGGLAALRDHVRAAQESDPACRLYPRFKMHDDIAAVAVSFSDPVLPAHTPAQSC